LQISKTFKQLVTRTPEIKVNTFYKIHLFILEREHVQTGRGGGGRERESSGRLSTECRTPREARSQDHEIMTRAEIKSQSLNRLSHPGVPKVDTFEMNMKIKIVGRKVEVINKKQVKQKWN